MAYRSTQLELERAVEALRRGDVVAFPTETVYGLGADARNDDAVRRIFELKSRPADHPLIVHLPDAAALGRWAQRLPTAAARLAAAFWPGPLTLVLPKAASVSTVVTGGQDTVGLRVPAHPIARQLLQAFGDGVAAPSANRYQRISPTRAEHVREEFGQAVECVLEGGDSTIGLESTIVAALDDQLTLLRPGSITRSQLQRAAGQAIVDAAADAPKAPGMDAVHYAPSTPVTVVKAGGVDDAARELSAGGARIGVLARKPPRRPYPGVTWINGGERAGPYGRALYANLRTLDRAGCERIVVEAVPVSEEWEAIADRLKRASARVS